MCWLHCCCSCGWQAWVIMMMAGCQVHMGAEDGLEQQDKLQGGNLLYSPWSPTRINVFRLLSAWVYFQDSEKKWFILTVSSFTEKKVSEGWCDSIFRSQLPFQKKYYGVYSEPHEWPWSRSNSGCHEGHVLSMKCFYEPFLVMEQKKTMNRLQDTLVVTSGQ